MNSCFFADIGVPTAGQCLQVLAPIAALVLLGWIVRHSDALIHRLMPHLEWERQLGWLNIRSERRAATILRGLGHLVHALLALALYGIVWSAEGMREVGRSSDPSGLGALVECLPVLTACLGLWALYLGGYLIPKLRREFEEEELQRFRAELAELARESEEEAVARNPKTPLQSVKFPSARPARSRRR